MSSLLLELLLPPRRNHAIRPDGLLLATLASPECYLNPFERARSFSEEQIYETNPHGVIAFIYIIGGYLSPFPLRSVMLIKR